MPSSNRISLMRHATRLLERPRLGPPILLGAFRCPSCPRQSLYPNGCSKAELPRPAAESILAGGPVVASPQVHRARRPRKVKVFWDYCTVDRPYSRSRGGRQLSQSHIAIQHELTKHNEQFLPRPLLEKSARRRVCSLALLACVWLTYIGFILNGRGQ